MDELRALGARIERASLEPQRVQVSWTTRLLRPVLRWMGFRPTFSDSKLRALVAQLAAARHGAVDWREAHDEASEELADNVGLAEEMCVATGRISLAHAGWLYRVHRVLMRSGDALADAQDGERRRIATAVDTVFPPLGLQALDAPVDPVEPEIDPSAVRLVELQLAAIDRIVDAARAEPHVLARRRDLLEAARRLLLDADATLPLDKAGVSDRKRYLSDEIVQIDRLQAAGLAESVGLLHQAKSALSRGDRDRLHAALVAMDAGALSSADHATLAATGEALEMLSAGQDTHGAVARSRSLERSTKQVFGQHVTTAISEARAAAHERLERDLEVDPDSRDMYQLALDYLAPEGDPLTHSAMLSVDGCFDVGAPLAPVRIRQQETRVRAVQFPTPELALMPAKNAGDIPQSIITDPRSVLLDFAAGRLLSRRYIRYERIEREQVRMMGEVRLYVLDGSTSMLEDGKGDARARMRDAILLAELATMMKRFEQPDRYMRVLLYYRYFTKNLGPLRRVSTSDEAVAAIGHIMERRQRGGTNIEKALLRTYSAIESARANDSTLARAQIVIITDGNAEVREEVLEPARQRTGVAIATSVIALGEENPALRNLVAAQRARGERAFYHFTDDDTLRRLCDGGLSGGRAIHLMDDRGDAALSFSERTSSMRSELSRLVDELAGLEQARHRALWSTDEHDHEAAAFRELGLEPDFSEAKRARREALDRDERALAVRFSRWFPPLEPARRQPLVGTQADIDAANIVLATVAEVISELDATPLQRQADAIEMLSRLLPDARLSPATYHAVLEAHPGAIAPMMAAVHEAVGRGCDFGQNRPDSAG